ncbi:hypothetical protein SAY87_029805 [Trapa incisa]|uniref:IBH1-like N-terminal domain-containing protein n=1 Tax=Trapa incisa TaxID=236973 RepID=A0AAN7K868_9MYRT|nr:hypothetical protein SAY87_029805 [Trapa incisa]
MMTCSTSHRLKMRADKSLLRQKFLKKWVKLLQLYSSSEKLATVIERKKLIELSADVALASARGGTTRWSRALIASAFKDSHDKTPCCANGGERTLHGSITRKITSKKVLQRIRGGASKEAQASSSNWIPASSIAKRLVKKRTKLLKKIVPGGESMDNVSLISETLDYIISLRAQIDVMRSLVYLSGHLDA